MIDKISQSFMKAMRKYLGGTECGNVIEHQYVHDKLMDSSEDMKLGQYFEYILGCLLMGEGKGALPKDGKVPEPNFYAKDQTKYNEYKAANPDKPPLVMAESAMMAPYQLAHKNARRVKDYFDRWGLKVLHVGKKYTKGRMAGVIDIVAECTKTITFDSGVKWKKGDKIVIDVKYSGLIDNQWNVNGWAWTPDQKRYHLTQANQYKFISNMDFYFLVVSSKNEFDIRMFYIPTTNEETFDDHISEGNFLMDEFKKLLVVGFIARPEVSRCAQCPLKAECKDKHEYPHVIQVA